MEKRVKSYIKSPSFFVVFTRLKIKYTVLVNWGKNSYQYGRNDKPEFQEEFIKLISIPINY